MTEVKAAPQKGKMSIAQWVSEYTGSHDIHDAEPLAQSFKDETGLEPTWRTQEVTVKEMRRALKREGRGGYVEGRDNQKVIGGLYVTLSLARYYVKDFHSTKMGRGFAWREALEALEKAGV